MRLRHFNVYTLDEAGPYGEFTPEIEEGRLLDIIRKHWEDTAQVIFVETFEGDESNDT